MHTFERVGELRALLARQYQARSAVRSNTTLASYDGCKKIQLAVSELAARH
ncbi:MAG: hypothetical protein EOO77_20190 [Oxalobacteraceae bacterium]|nr:MAG: hypothetical protein EOO77_20190 [Oxalobacteraceae bacterium]